MRDFLEAFHVEDLPLLRAGEKTAVPEESAPLVGVGAANRRVLSTVQQQVPRRTATLDVDATILEADRALRRSRTRARGAINPWWWFGPSRT